MPIEVDSKRRLDQIADATLRVAERDGPGAITIRRVAAELGGSSTVVTNYLKTRADLLLNAVRFEQRSWSDDLESAKASARNDPRARLDALIIWSTSTLIHDTAARQIWMDLVARAPGAGASALLREDAAGHHREFRTAVAELDLGDQSKIADGLYLAVRGFYFAATEDPDRWSADRAAEAILAIAELLVRAEASSRASS